jgi:hypothetical protein
VGARLLALVVVALRERITPAFWNESMMSAAFVGR